MRSAQRMSVQVYVLIALVFAGLLAIVLRSDFYLPGALSLVPEAARSPQVQEKEVNNTNSNGNEVLSTHENFAPPNDVAIHKQSDAMTTEKPPFSETFYNPYSQRLDEELTFDPPGIAPCGQVCTYTGTVVNSTTGFYPQLHKHIDCPNIMSRMAFRDHNITYPPPQTPPESLKDVYEMYGDMQISSYHYINQAEHLKLKATGEAGLVWRFTRDDIEHRIQDVLDQKKANSYKDNNCVVDTLVRYKDKIRNTQSVVIGTIRPWLEAILLAYGARNVTTLEYQELISEYPGLDTRTPYNFAEKYLQGQTVLYDFGASFSSVEHSGLGRYSDPLNPYGDLEAMAQAWCMIKPGGMFALGIPMGQESGIVWNAHRLYTETRLQYLTANWRVVDMSPCGLHSFIMLIKE